MPAFMVQPLVENSIAHGMRADGQPLEIQVVVVAGEGDGSWLLRVTDNGIGMDLDLSRSVFFGGSSQKGMGVALGNVSDRLRGFYGPESQLTIESTPEEGTEITFRIHQES
jgi:two-component system sensor histidine kinase LytS